MLGARIAALRRNIGLSQAELAARLQISPSTVGMYEQGRREPAADILVALSQIFGVSTDYLLTGAAGTPAQQQIVHKAAAQGLMDAQAALLRRRKQPFSREDLTVLFAALMLEP